MTSRKRAAKSSTARPADPNLTAEVIAYLRALPADEVEELRAFMERGEQPKSPARLRLTVGTFVLLTQLRRGAWQVVDAVERLRRLAAIEAAMDGKTLRDVIEEALTA